MADVPKDLVAEIKRLEEMFTVDKTKLKTITDHFITELDKGKFKSYQIIIWKTSNQRTGLSVEGGSIVSWLTRPLAV